ncbi:MAG: ComF family protein [Candidatus Omnitrophica bacterium]|nr:ComF family protein [Candidatus Omnitrophota bacterium]
MVSPSAVTLPIREILTGLRSLLLPVSCPCCAAPVEDASQCPLCPDCLPLLRFLKPPWCAVCGRSLAHQGAGIRRCGICLTRRFAFDQVISACHYEGPIKELISALKYEGHLSVSRFLGRILEEAVRGRLKPAQADAVVAVPLHPVRLRERSFNQAHVLASELAGRLGVPCRPDLLKREKPTSPQTALRRRQRWENLRAAFTCRADSLEGKRLLLVDDVLTTGATAHECAKVLKRAGAASVVVVTVANG